MSVFVEGIIVAASAIIVAGVVLAVRTLFAMRRDIVGFTPSLQAMVEIQPLMVRATRHQNAALREIGANGSTLKADACLDDAEAVLNRLLVVKVGGSTI